MSCLASSRDKEWKGRIDAVQVSPPSSVPEQCVNKKENNSAMQLNASEWGGEGAVGDDVSRGGVFGCVNLREVGCEDEGGQRLESSMF